LPKTYHLTDEMTPAFELRIAVFACYSGRDSLETDFGRDDLSNI